MMHLRTILRKSSRIRGQLRHYYYYDGISVCRSRSDASFSSLSSSSSSNNNNLQPTQQSPVSITMKNLQNYEEEVKEEELQRILSQSIIRRIGDHPYGSRQYVLLGREKQQPQRKARVEVFDKHRPPQLVQLASISAHRNILFGAQGLHGYNVQDICRPLALAALEDASANAEQPQALSTMYGLCQYVQDCISGDIENSTALEDMKNNDTVLLECITAIATGTPRPGQTVVGVNTHRDGAVGWTALAKEYAHYLRNQQQQKQRASSNNSTTSSSTSSSMMSYNNNNECLLYWNLPNSELIDIELLADTKPDYLHSAGGAMARFFFL